MGMKVQVRPSHAAASFGATFAFQGDRTVMTDRYYSDLSGLADPFDLPEAEPNYVCTRQTSLPESLTGDHYHSEWELGEGTHVMLSSTSATRLHPTPSIPSSVNHHFRLGKGATLEYFPECVIPFKGSSSSLAVTFELEERAILAYADIWSAGRIHRGEAFQFRALPQLDGDMAR
ncbi:urease accessory protein UreD [Paenibacillus amylolyticus]|nr:urease accessory protein UreD [Paenibacillus amylolyticus]